jgi:hypothetical protein
LGRTICTEEERISCVRNAVTDTVAIWLGARGPAR